MIKENPIYFSDVSKCVDRIIETVGKTIVFGMPLALGKPNHLVNALYQRAKSDLEIRLTIYTALSLERPRCSGELERRFMAPIDERLWGGFVEFDYMADLRSGNLPPNVTISEFFVKAGGYLGNKAAQRNYISSNYTHVIRDILDRGLNVMGNLIAKRRMGSETRYSMSCNADLPLELFDHLEDVRRSGRKIVTVGQVNTNLPFMYGDAEVSPDHYDLVLDSPQYDFPLFSVPKQAVATADYMIGAHVSSLVKDDGTLQIGIGSLGDGIAESLIMRHRHNATYRELLKEAKIDDRYDDLVNRIGGREKFEKGLYGATEMFVDVFMQLYRSGIVKRKVYEDEMVQAMVNDGTLAENIDPGVLDRLIDKGAISPQLSQADFDRLQRFGIFRSDLSLAGDTIRNHTRSWPADLSRAENRERVARNCLGTRLENGTVCQAAFFIGPRQFYDSLNAMSERERKLFCMTGVNKVNQLYGDERLRRLQRKDGRFVNAGMMVTLLGAVTSDCLECGNVISGVGGQYNFVSMAHALDDGRLIMMIRSTRCKGTRVLSNIVLNYGHVTIPRHLRDIVVTEYGIADLRGKSDEEVIKAMLNIADSRFQGGLLAQAKQTGKIARNYQIPEEFRHNTPERLEKLLAPYRRQGFFRAFPFGSDFTDEEIVIGKALKGLQRKAAESKLRLVPAVARQLLKKPDETLRPYLARMGLAEPAGIRERIMQAAVSYALEAGGEKAPKADCGCRIETVGAVQNH
ncbi:acetyl-CoA hydrolase/transferase C-terminal domain-containing protein [uncultured Desulfosarcina sp.]|uniref:acetyl-CoA hydrolase/transferase C-terminal domain-containing protein n=1 Tax=uncultured Desulfosarcina sp. TaxID=218289 RepID=UPI0029C69DF7|nr:acetyl-CoA hydrolase/transferase C-terminal domain-containing protein [uncultured Desulfosarcina sp.]